MKLENKVALVTGGGSGLGRAIAQRFAVEGATVVVNDLTLDSAKATVDSLADGAPAGHPVAADVSDSAQVRAMFDEIAATHGRLDVLVNNAGIIATPGDGSEVFGQAAAEQELPPPLITFMEDDGWHALLKVHLDGAFFCSREGVKLMLRSGGGAIINMSSIAGLSGIGVVHYSTAKGGLLGLTRQLARDLAPHNIRVNAIAPGWIDTPMTRPYAGEVEDGFLAITPMGRVGRPEEIASAALYLASDESSFTTGQWLSPNGGIFIG